MSLGRTILVVDDVDTNVQVVRASIEPFGHRVIAASTVREAIRMAQGETPDLVLSDVNMPEGDGFDLIRAFRADARLKRVPFIFMTSTHWPAANRARGLALGAKRFLERPIEPELLLDEVNNTLSKFNG